MCVFCGSAKTDKNRTFFLPIGRREKRRAAKSPHTVAGLGLPGHEAAGAPDGGRPLPPIMSLTPS